MTLLEVIELWENEQAALMREIAGFKPSEYKEGYLEGMEAAVGSLKALIAEHIPADVQTDRRPDS